MVNHKIEWRSRTLRLCIYINNVDTMLGGYYRALPSCSNLSAGFVKPTAQDTQVHGYPTCVVKHLKPASNHPDSLQTLRWLFTEHKYNKLGNHNRIPQLLAHFEENLEFYLVQEFIGHLLSAELNPVTGMKAR